MIERWMDSGLDGWMDGWMDRKMDRWMDTVDRLMDGVKNMQLSE